MATKLVIFWMEIYLHGNWIWIVCFFPAFSIILLRNFSFLENLPTQLLGFKMRWKFMSKSNQLAYDGLLSIVICECERKMKNIQIQRAFCHQFTEDTQSKQTKKNFDFTKWFFKLFKVLYLGRKRDQPRLPSGNFIICFTPPMNYNLFDNAKEEICIFRDKSMTPFFMSKSNQVSEDNRFNVTWSIFLDLKVSSCYSLSWYGRLSWCGRQRQQVKTWENILLIIEMKRIFREILNEKKLRINGKNYWYYNIFFNVLSPNVHKIMKHNVTRSE